MNNPLHIPAGFRWAAGTAGLKASGKPDLAVAITDHEATAAAMFTTNRMVAAPVSVGRSHLRESRGRVRAVVVNAGNANCATGPHGAKAAKAVCAATAELLNAPITWIFPSSTGIIGVPLPYEKIQKALPDVLKKAERSEGSVRAFAAAIMTTDTRPKLASLNIPTNGKRVRLLGLAKGSGMIHPTMATMLTYIFTDATVSPAAMKMHLRKAVRESFNRISVDGDTSTNDTVLILASGESGVAVQGKDSQRFQAALTELCSELAMQVIADGEGVKHVVEVVVEKARSEAEALQVARSVVTSSLVKTAWAGADPNWGRILAAVGRSGIALDPGKVDIYLGDQPVCSGGAAIPFDRSRAHQTMLQPRYSIRVRLHRGRAMARYFGSDLTAEYVRINADYST